MPELMKFDRTKSTMRWRPPNGTAGFERSRVSGWRRSPLPPAMIIARTRGRRAMALGLARLGPRGVEVGEDEILALEPVQRVGGVRAHRLSLGQRPCHL